jgi:hypothetical protein
VGDEPQIPPACAAFTEHVSDGLEQVVGPRRGGEHDVLVPLQDLAVDVVLVAQVAMHECVAHARLLRDVAHRHGGEAVRRKELFGGFEHGGGCGFPRPSRAFGRRAGPVCVDHL